MRGGVFGLPKGMYGLRSAGNGHQVLKKHFQISQRGNNATNLEMPAIGGLRSFSSVGRGVAGSRAKTLFSPGVLSLVSFLIFSDEDLSQNF